MTRANCAAWDNAIRAQIRSGALFVPIVSAHTRARVEGYFRLKWKLAVDRSHLMAAEKPFLVPVVIDDTRQDDACVPDKFREIQWTRLTDGETTSEFLARIRRLLAPVGNATEYETSPVERRAPAATPRRVSLPLRNPEGAEFQIAETYAYAGNSETAF